jgi:hypothetical protein
VKHPLGNYGLSIILAILFIISWIGQTVVGWNAFRSEQLAHGEIPAWFGPSGYVWHWGEATLENWQSEFLQLLTFVVLTSIFIHKGSHESKDTDEEFRTMLQRIQKRLDEK